MYRYYSGKAQQFFKRPDIYGLMLTYRDTGQQKKALQAGCRWMIDNGAFSGNFDPARWQRRLYRFLPYADQCDGVVMPDAVILNSNGDFVRGDWEKTLEKLYQYLPMVPDGLPIAYAVQDNHPIDAMPWGDIDVLFIAGCDEWKTCYQVEQIAKEAKRRNKRVHIGRVSQVKRMAGAWWADSYDGTTFKWEPEVKHQRFDPILSGQQMLSKQWRLI